MESLGPVEALDRIAYLLERTREPTYRVRAFRNAARIVRGIDPDKLLETAAAGGLKTLPGIGDVTERVILEALAGETPGYLVRLEEAARTPLSEGEAGASLRAALRGDCHTHSNWSDGGSPIEEMARAAREIGHDYMVLTDHSQNLSIAKGLSRERLERQIVEVARVNEELSPFRILMGMEVDIFEDGSLDMGGEVLGALDVVVGSVHSKLRMPADEMTHRMVAALANPHLDILGHCTGRLVVGRGRPESTFDADIVFAAAAKFDKAIEINSRPERLDPPRRLLRLAREYGCRFSIDTDAHAPGQLDWQIYGCARAEECDVTPDEIVNTGSADALLDWARSHSA